MHISRHGESNRVPISAPYFFRALAGLMTNIKMSLVEDGGKASGWAYFEDIVPCLLFEMPHVWVLLASRENNRVFHRRQIYLFGTASAMSSDEEING